MRSNNGSHYSTGIKISQIASCDFQKMKKISNEELLKTGGREVDPRLLTFIERKMGVLYRHHCLPDMTSLDLARDALGKLLEKDPSLKKEAEFFIFAGISSPLPTVCMSAFLSCEFELENVSCWDLKSGCSSGLLAYIQALDWFSAGAKKGIIVCAETLSKFANPEMLQMSLSTGDGAIAMSVERTNEWKVLGVVHGTDARFFKSLYVPGIYPMNIASYKEEDYYFKTDGKNDALEQLEIHWNASLKQLIEISSVDPKVVKHYIAHQVDASKNKACAQNAGIDVDCIAINIQEYGNMGCPTIFLNYKQWAEKKKFIKDDVLILHAVGGGISWAGLCLQKQ